MTQPKAISLISGGLDSLLATKLVMEQGVHVEGINFFTGFCVEGHTHAIRKRDQKKEKRNNALWCAEQLGIKLHIIDVIEEYKDVLLNPKHGYGANLNPCQDCKTFMIHKALEWIQEHDFDFIITGEVVGQRPMSQRKDLMPVIARESGANDLLLRPLCGKNLPETKAEREGWVKREELLGFSGRNRKPQMALAAQYGFTDYATPAGGCCFLTDENYSKKVVDMWQHRPSRDYELDDIMLLKVGRHIRPRPNFKMIIGREEGENKFMEGYRKQFISLYTTSHSGPLVLLDGKDISDEDIELAGRIAARFGQGRDAERVDAQARLPDGTIKEYSVTPMPSDEISEAWYV